MERIDLFVDKAEDHAPLIRLWTEDGPCIGVHPDVRGYRIFAHVPPGWEWVLVGFETEDCSEEAYQRAERLMIRIQAHLDAGKTLNDNKWACLRAIYGTPAWEQEFSERIEAHVNMGGSMAEFLANN